MGDPTAMEPADWLEQVREQALEPELPIIDPHHHLWDRPDLGRYRMEELRADLESGHLVVGTVFVECHSAYRSEGPEALRPVGETEFVEALAAPHAGLGEAAPGPCAGIVGHADLLLGAAVEEVLEAHLAASPRFRGIRHVSAWDPVGAVRYPMPWLRPGLLADPRFREGFARLARFGLSFDAWLFHPQLPELTDLARSFPDVAIVLDHLGGPLGVGAYAERRGETFAAWQRDLAELARCGNVAVKLGGLAMDINGFGWHERPTPPGSDELAAATRDHFLHAIDCFGPERCMFESNFPVDRQSCSYAVLWNAFKRIARGFGAGEKAALFKGTAERIYRL